MNLKLTNFSTIIIVNKNQEQTQAIRVKTKHLKRVKHYIASVVLVIASLVGTIVYLNSKDNQSEQEKQKLLSQIAQLKGKVSTATALNDAATVSTSSANSYIQSIQNKLEKINDYLRKRGLKGFSTNSIGGDKNIAAPSMSDNEKYSLYDEYMSRLLNSVAFTPMGYPRLSSITSAFGYRSDPFESEHAELHPGIDFRGAKGDPVHVTADGNVVFTGRKGGYGNCIIVSIKTISRHFTDTCRIST